MPKMYTNYCSHLGGRTEISRRQIGNTTEVVYRCNGCGATFTEYT